MKFIFCFLSFKQHISQQKNVACCKVAHTGLNHGGDSGALSFWFFIELPVYFSGTVIVPAGYSTGHLDCCVILSGWGLCVHGSDDLYAAGLFSAVTGVQLALVL